MSMEALDPFASCGSPALTLMVEEASERFEELLDLVETGKTVAITRGETLALLVPHGTLLRANT